MRILVVTPRYAIAGVPLAQFRFARALAAAGHDVDLMIGRVDSHLELPVCEGVQIIRLDKPKVRHMFPSICRYLRRVRPDVVFSAEDHLNAVVLTAAIITRSKAKISGSCRVTPFDTYSDVPLTKRWMLKQAMRLIGRRANALTCVSRDMVLQYREVYRSSPHTHVYHIVVDGAAGAKMAEPVEEPWLVNKVEPVIVAAGSLQPWKGFADLIQAMRLLKERGRVVRLIILGEGPLHAELQGLAESLGLVDRVKLPGFTHNPLKYFALADAFVLSSHVEGMPNVLIEAMMCGCTPVATDCPTGPREVLQNGRYGYLVNVRDPAALADGIELALKNPIPSEILAEAVLPFEQNAVIRRHFELLGLMANRA